MSTSTVATLLNDSDAAFDKFATLFSPGTPRASPTLDPVPDPAPSIVTKRPPHSRRNGFNTDSGPFVSVSSNEDPLGLDFLPEPVGHSSSTASGKQNSTLSFFEQFGQHAKAAVDMKRYGLLEELLMHEDDPLYWLATYESEPSYSDDIPSHTKGRPPEEDPSASLLDVDNDFFTTDLISTQSATSSPPTTRKGHQHHPGVSTARATSLLLPPVHVAPPLAVTHSTSPDSSSQRDEQVHQETTSTATSTSPPRSPHSSSSSSTLPSLSRLMTSFRSSSPRHPPLDDTTQTQRSTAPAPHPDSESVPAKQAPPRQQTDPHPSHSQLQSNARFTTSPPQQEVYIKHGTPFSYHHHRSPFASHIYTPPSGAPGYAGEKYDWDRGFSEELQREAVEDGEGPPEKRVIDGNGNTGGGEEAGEREMVGRGTGRGRDAQGAKDERRKGRDSVGGKGSTGVAGLMEKRGGDVELLGRKAMTVGVLTVEVANLIRPHLPALARLPRKWTLVYSLDQHGISLNTLYSRCEAAAEHRPNQPRQAGQLIVVKDEGDELFGVWMGKEGVKVGKGRESGYYGSGECFLWKYPSEIVNVKVFKWTGRNDYVALCEPGFISFGGGDGNYGLYLDDTLFEGSSAYCPTFANEPLCSGELRGGLVKFECVGLEVWGVGP